MYVCTYIFNFPRLDCLLFTEHKFITGIQNLFTKCSEKCLFLYAYLVTDWHFQTCRVVTY